MVSCSKDIYSSIILICLVWNMYLFPVEGYFPEVVCTSKFSRAFLTLFCVHIVLSFYCDDI